jgi:small subunit ribosomal protein S20
MPHCQSAKKRLKQSLILQERNRSTKRSLKTEIRKVLEAVKSGSLEQAQSELSVAAKKLDRAAARKIIHRNAAARTKSRLSARIKAAKKTAAAK